MSRPSKRRLIIIAVGLGSVAAAAGLSPVVGRHRDHHQTATQPRAASDVGARDRRAAPARRTVPATSTSRPALNVSGTVTTEQVSITDSTRALRRRGLVLAPGRDLPTIVWRPRAPGRYPLVVFVHGYNIGPLAYARFCHTLASSGYVVAAPSFPLEDPGRNYGLDRGDLPNEATDVSVVITRLLGSPLADHISSGTIAVAGHSDGADVALMVGYQAGRLDLRVHSVVAIAPDAMTGAIAPSGPPLLLVQGDADSIVPYSNSRRVFGQLSARRYYMTLLGADHLPPIAGGTPWTSVLDSAVEEFLTGAATSGSALDSAFVNRFQSSGLERLEVAG